MPLTPADVRNKQFSTTRLRPGYDEEEVDAFLDEVEAELDRLIQENEELRAKLAECLRGGKIASTGAELPAARGSSPSCMSARAAGAGAQAARAGHDGREPHSRGQHGHGGACPRPRAADRRPGHRRRAPRGRRDPGPRPPRGRRHLSKARRQAEQITGDARARAESLERDAQERHRQAMGSLVQTREELERKVDDLRAFEREYRSRLKAYLEGQLRELEAGATDTGGFRPWARAAASCRPRIARAARAAAVRARASTASRGCAALRRFPHAPTERPRASAGRQRQPARRTCGGRMRP